ncbi:DUF2232 domain-containing protein [Aneurinibacillus thermoaerophilus]|uniref:Uncharacterized conserved protein YybS, DUF2232 family n=1 Tax=Aneurinibacillus thermoaerophilus TaxID=143495 RepID=A0A1G8DCU2_ANETH|nr:MULTISPECIES: DUF2232 domain-containing protein [Aneurinibacillus]AMA71472.1 hypothetical protein ACH33_00495 [Aneurinibacillus sp. XH2]MED0675351.1 DUF2232 domain-containing protein [Aneurinibacillus thermoaerophilus]MED0679138.1 DUF2232 domain-containing protein [Aneurinibacillus thermoaerophilus]MED0757460.1 DUF2232 domain-containing protein [Aneurinibacillus thermoaerophilus]MED0759199.1 DUF2232 domain-containing protein [Aneurinibacillus thermoaerophilus]
MQNNVRAILEGAFVSAIFLVLFFIAFYTPLSIVAVFALPLPLTVYGYRHEAKAGGLAAFVTVFLSFIFAGFPGLLLSFPAAVMGLVMGVAYRKKKSAGQVLMIGTLVELTFMFVSIGLALAVMKINPLDDMIKAMREISEQVLTDMQKQIENSVSQLPEDQRNEAQTKQLAQLKESLGMMKAQVTSLITAIIPGLLISSSLLSALINHAFFRRISQRMGVQIQSLPALHNLRFPRSILYYYFIVLFLFMIKGLQDYHFLYMAVLNIMLVLQLLFFVQGLGFIAYWIHQRNASKGLLFIAVILFLIPPFTYILLLIGVLDVGFNLRNRFFR